MSEFLRIFLKMSVLETQNNVFLEQNLSQEEEFSVFTSNPQMMVRNFNLSLRKPFQWGIKRFIDVAGSIIGGIIISPLLLTVILAIKLDSKGPVVFKQPRIGKYGKIYTMYKFRSMYEDAEARFEEIKQFNENEVFFKMANDPRITKVGKILRKFSLDELPQLINVIKGDMSLVGPRPSPVNEIDAYQRSHYLRLATLPGLTGMWQISGRSEIKSFDEVVNLDFGYIQNWNLWLDFKILLKTVPVVIFGKGAL